jgi:HEPN domain-containing protein
MTPFNADTLYLAIDDLSRFQQRVESLYEKKGGQERLPLGEARRWRSVISIFFMECDRAGLRSPLERLYKLRDYVATEELEDNYSVETLRHELRELREAAFTDLRKRRFLRIEDAAELYYENSKLFGNLVSQRFPKASYDIQEAGTCRAAGRHTACVFHLMRAVEHALRALAKRLKVPRPKTFELKTWEELIRNIEDEIEAIRKKPRTTQRAKDLEFYNAAAAQFRYFKDGWRNCVMHSRASYDEPGAMIVMVHVRDFMQHLATRLRG